MPRAVPAGPSEASVDEKSHIWHEVHVLTGHTGHDPSGRGRGQTPDVGARDERRGDMAGTDIAS